ncbi:MAG TPA: hypothetical protein VF695_15080 [Sphingomonas sp.]|jgi:hypothetical protein
MLIAAILLQAAAGDVVVVARNSCDLSVAGKAVRGKALDRYAAEWRAGRPVRIMVPAALRTRCLAKVMFRLHDRGVTRADFIDAP